MGGVEEELSLRDVLNVLCRRAWIVLVTVFVAVVITALLSYVILSPVYQADTTLIVNEKQTATQDNSGIDYGQIQTSQALAVTYAKIISSRTILQDVIQRLALPDTYKQLSGRTTVAVQGSTEIIDVSVKDKSPDQAALIANTIAGSFMQQLPRLVNRVDNVSVIDRAVPVTQQVSPRPVLNLAVAFVAALLVGILLAFLADYLDDTVKTPDDVKRLFDLRVLAVIPDMQTAQKEARYGKTY